MPIRLLTLILISAWMANAHAGFSFGDINLKGVYDVVTKTSKLGDKSDEEAEEVGAEITEVLLKKAPPLQNSPLQNYVNKVGIWLAMNSERPDLNWKFIVVDDKIFNAFAAPGGTIFITKGTMLEIESEAELATILAHEIAHVLKKHYLSAIKSETKLSIASDVGRLAYDASDDSGGFGSGPAVHMGYDTESQFIGAVDGLYSKGLARSDEYEADAMAMVIAARAGYDPFAFVAVLQKIGSQSSNDSEWATFLKRHPKAEERITNLEPIMDQPFAQALDYRQLPDRYLSFMK